MKKLIVALLVLTLFPFIGICGELVTTPQDIVLSPALSDKVDKIKITFWYEAGGDHNAVIHYNIVDPANTNIIQSESVRIQNIADNPISITADCIGPEDPWPLCTGAGTCTNDCDETDTSFTDFVAGFGATLKSRADTEMWQDIQSKYTTQP